MVTKQLFIQDNNNARMEKTIILIDRCSVLTENTSQPYVAELYTVEPLPILGTEERSGWKELAVVERFQTRVNAWIFCLPGRK